MTYYQDYKGNKNCKHTRSKSVKGKYGKYKVCQCGWTQGYRKAFTQPQNKEAVANENT